MSQYITVPVYKTVSMEVDTDVELDIDEFVAALSDEAAQKLLEALQARAATETPEFKIPPQLPLEKYVAKFNELNKLKP